MVLFAPMLERKLINRGMELGKELGMEEERQKWQAWLKRRDEAEANNQPFDEPPPSLQK